MGQPSSLYKVGRNSPAGSNGKASSAGKLCAKGMSEQVSLMGCPLTLDIWEILTVEMVFNLSCGPVMTLEYLHWLGEENEELGFCL